MQTVRLRHEDILLDGTAQSVRNEETLHVRSGRYDINPQEEVKPQQFVIGTRWNRIGIVCRTKIICESGEWSSAKKKEKNLQCYRRLRWTFNGINGTHGKESPKELFHCKYDRSHTETNFDISTKLVSEQDEISGFEKIGCENHSWKYLSSIVDERINNFQRTKVSVISDSVLCFGKIFEILNLTMHGSKN